MDQVLAEPDVPVRGTVARQGLRNVRFSLAGARVDGRHLASRARQRHSKSNRANLDLTPFVLLMGKCAAHHHVRAKAGHRNVAPEAPAELVEGGLRDQQQGKSVGQSDLFALGAEGFTDLPLTFFPLKHQPTRPPEEGLEPARRLVTGISHAHSIPPDLHHGGIQIGNVHFERLAIRGFESKTTAGTNRRPEVHHGRLFPRGDEKPRRIRKHPPPIPHRAARIECQRIHRVPRRRFERIAVEP